MKRVAVDQAFERLNRAEAAFSAMIESTCFPTFMRSWSDFLQAVGAVYTKLERGSKSNGANIAWYGSIKHIRKTDSLLRYLHHARDVDLHGLSEVAEHDPGGWGIRGGGRYIFNGIIGPGGSLTVRHLSGPPPEEVTVLPHPKLIAVVDDRFGTAFPVPSSHLGETLTDASPKAVAALALAYLRAVLLEAQDRVVDG